MPVIGTNTPLTIDQIRTNLPSTPADRFEFLRHQRKITLEAIDEATTELKALTANITLAQSRKDSLMEAEKERYTGISWTKERIQNALQRAKDELTTAKQQLDTAKTKKDTPPDEIQRLENNLRTKQDYVSEGQDALDNYDQRRKEEEKRKQDAQAAITSATEELSKLNISRDKMAQSQLAHQRLLGEIDDMVNQLFISSDATNSFKLKMSIAFAALVAVVIIGFFAIAWSNEEVKKAIFSNDAGIQFITMFAIVIQRFQHQRVT